MSLNMWLNRRIEIKFPYFLPHSICCYMLFQLKYIKKIYLCLDVVGRTMLTTLQKIVMLGFSKRTEPMVCMCVYVCMFTYICIYVFIYIYVCMYLYTHTFTDCKYLYRHIYSLTVLYSINYKMRFITLTYTEAEYSPKWFHRLETQRNQ